MPAAARFPVVFATGQNPAAGERAVWFPDHLWGIAGDGFNICQQIRQTCRS